MTAPRVADSPARVEFAVEFSRGPKGRRRAREASRQPDPFQATGPSVPKITRLLVLGHHFERLVREGKVKDYAEIARLTGLTRARVTQIVNLTLLAPKIQQAILERCRGFEGQIPLIERQLRPVASEACWLRQQRILRASSADSDTF